VSDARFPTAPSAGVVDATGDAQFPVDSGGSNVPQLDLTDASVTLDGDNLNVHIGVKDLSTLASPDTGDQTNVWWVAVWKFQNHLYFAKAQSNAGGTPTFAAGLPTSYDRPGICMCTSPTLVDYSGGTAVDGKQNGNGWDITVPRSLVGGPAAADQLGSFAAFTMLDNGKPLVVSPAVSNIPSIVDATPTSNVRVLPPGAEPLSGGNPVTGSVQNAADSGHAAAVSTPNTSGATSSSARAVGLGIVVAVGAVLLGRRRRERPKG
jgi:LPXTG-motif cell wall-anchored protein